MIKKNLFNKNKIYLITGAAGFIGFHFSKKLLERGETVIGFDNINDYYDVSLKQARLEILSKLSKYENFGNFVFIKGDLADKEAVFSIFEKHHPGIVVNLAAQAGVRYSIINPEAYIQSNINGFFHILEACRYYPAEHLIFASSSSVYGGNEKVPFSTRDRTDRPVSLYAATKKSNELMAYSYSYLYKIPITGLRFFTVYGPMGRPDMAYYTFAEKIMREEPIPVYNHGEMYRDFTYIDDIVTGMEAVLSKPPAKDQGDALYKIYNIGNNRPENLMYFIEVLEKSLGKKAIIEFLPMQPGDVYRTCADIDDLVRDFNFKPETGIETGLKKFAEWFLKI